eukprot:TRINITY_DN41113_c0_g1_i1.p1 TRINITY_DN41113_c0_g1~~TRINITY_DN41113_c0_g1_i1.p1  ORF type:complete len:1734 (+),score=288.09 TRINITY_DN41113_c0_g1_i1:173-5203(+)
MLAWTLKRSDESEDEVLQAVKEIVIEPLNHRSVTDAATIPIARALCKFDTPRLTKALTPIAGWLSRQYCKHNAQPNKEITLLLAVATRDPQNTVLALAFDTANGASGGAPPTRSDALPMQTINALENKQNMQNDSTREQYMFHLQIVTNTCMVGQRVIEVYEKKGLSKDLVKSMKHFFGEAPTSSGARGNGGAGRKTIDITKMKTMDVRTCSALMDACTALMSQSREIMNDLVNVNVRRDHVAILDYLLLAPKHSSTACDPVLLTSSLRGIHLIVQDFSRENQVTRSETLASIIEAVDNMDPMLEYIDVSSRRFKSLFQNAEKHLFECSDGTSSKRGENQRVPSTFGGLLNPLLHECFDAIVQLIDIFTVEGKTCKQCKAVSDAMNAKERERLLFKLLEVPNAKVKATVMKCISHVDIADMSSTEVGYIVNILSSIRDVASEESVLEKVIDQLQFLLGQTRGGALSLRSDYAAACCDGVARVLCENARRSTYGVESEEQQKIGLARSCVMFLQTASGVRELRTPHLRSLAVRNYIVESLRCEDSIGLPTGRDICCENTWTGRSVDVLLQSISGPNPVKPRGRVAYRLLARTADVLQGQSDIELDAGGGMLGNGEEIGNPADMSCQDALERPQFARECLMWDEGDLQTNLRFLDDMQIADVEMQQSIFVSFHGFHRMVGFLDATFKEEEHTLARMRETTTMEDAATLVESIQKEVPTVMDNVRSNRKFPINLETLSKRIVFAKGALPMTNFSAVAGFGQQFGMFNTPEPALRYEGQEFDGYDFVDLALPPHSFTQSFGGGAISISFAAKWASLRSGSRIIDFGSGAPCDNIIISNQARSRNLVFAIFQGRGIADERLTCVNAIHVGETHCYLFTVDAKGRMKVFIDGDLVGEKENGLTPAYARRTQMFVGNSHWPEDGRFVGTISNLLLFTGVAVEWSNIEHNYDDEHIQMDGVESNHAKKTLLSESTTSVDSVPMVRERQALPGSLGYVTSLRSLPKINETFFAKPLDGKVSIAYLVAAVLRCAFGILESPISTRSLREKMAISITEELIVNQLISLVSLCGVFDLCCAAKFLRIMSLSLELHFANYKVNSNMYIPVYFALGRYLDGLCEGTLVALKQRTEPVISQRASMLAIDMVRLASVIAKSVYKCDFSKVGNVGLDECGRQFNTHCVMLCLQHVLSERTVHFITDMVLYQPDAAEGSAEGLLNSKQIKDMADHSVILDYSRKVLSIILECVPRFEHMISKTIATAIVTGGVQMRRAFLASILLKTHARSELRTLEVALHAHALSLLEGAFDAAKSTLKIGAGEEGSEKAIVATIVEAFPANDRAPHAAYMAADKVSCVVTNRAMYLLDASAPGHPHDPRVLLRADLADITRIMHGGSPQHLVVSLHCNNIINIETTGPVQHIALVCHVEQDRHELVSALHLASSVPCGDVRDDVPVCGDGFFLETLHDRIAETIVLTSFGRRNNELCFFVLTDMSMHDFTVNFSSWYPVEGRAGDDESLGDDDIASKPLKRSGGKAAPSTNGTLLANVYGGTSSAEVGGAAGGIPGDDDAGEESSATYLAMKAGEISDRRRVCRVAADAITEAAMKDGSITWARQNLLRRKSAPRPLRNLERVAFTPDMMPKLHLGFGLGDSLTICFLDDMTRDSWRRQLMATLSKDAGDNWVRGFEAPGQN